MEDLIHIHTIKGMLSQSGCPEDLLEHYLKFLQTGGQQVQIIRGEVNVMFQKEEQYRKRRNEAMRGSVTFYNKDKGTIGSSDTGIFIGMEFIQSCFQHGILARMSKVRREHGKVMEIEVVFGV